MSKPRLFWSARYSCWIYFSSWVHREHDRLAERFCARLNELNKEITDGN